MMRREELLAVLTDNFAVFRTRSAEAQELRGITVRQLIDALCHQTEPDPEECFSAFCQLLPDATVEEQLLLCRACLDHTEISKHGWQALLPTPFNVACMEAPAHRVFLSKMEKLSIPTVAISVSGFTQGCEEVLDGKSNACILPLFSTVDGKLYRFYDMLERYDLNILMACDIDSQDGEKTVRYALSGYPEQIDLGSLSLPRCLEFSITDTDSRCAETVASAVKELGGGQLLVDSLPLPFGTGMYRFYFTLQLPAESEEILKLYLSLRFPGYAVIGSYFMLPRASLS